MNACAGVNGSDGVKTTPSTLTGDSQYEGNCIEMGGDYCVSTVDYENGSGGKGTDADNKVQSVGRQARYLPSAALHGHLSSATGASGAAPAVAAGLTGYQREIGHGWRPAIAVGRSYSAMRAITGENRHGWRRSGGTDPSWTPCGHPQAGRNRHLWHWEVLIPRPNRGKWLLLL